MTENEVKSYMENEIRCIQRASICDRDCAKCDLVKEEKPLLEAFGVAIQALEEVQQYRAIETELRDKYNANVDIKMLMQHFIETIFKGEKHEGFCILTNEDAKMWDAYKAIGTVEELQVLKENQRNCKDCAGCTVWKCDCANIRDKAIDEFAERLKEKSKHFLVSGIVIDEVAEQLKGGAE